MKIKPETMISLGYGVSIACGLLLIWQEELNLLTATMGVVGPLLVLQGQANARKAATKTEESDE